MKELVEVKVRPHLPPPSHVDRRPPHSPAPPTPRCVCHQTEMERQMQISEDILRFMTIRVEELEQEPSAMMQKRDRDDRRDRERGRRRDDEGFGGGGGFGGDRGDRGDRGGDRPERGERPERNFGGEN